MLCKSQPVTEGCHSLYTKTILELICIFGIIVISGLCMFVLRNKITVEINVIYVNLLKHSIQKNNVFL